MSALQLTRTHRILIGVVVTGAVIIAGIGFAGSYAAVRELAAEKGFGDFSLVFPIGIDAGICVLLALDLLLTWMRIPFPLLRQTAWLLTAATIAFNGAASWPDPLGVGMHAVIPVLFVVSVEAARHAVGRIADITADKHMEGVRLTRWLLSPVPTFRLWRRMKLWELRSYEQVIKLEQDRLIYQARLQARFGRAWKRKAPVESLMPLRLAKYGVPLADTGPAGLAAAGIEPVLLPPAPTVSGSAPALPAAQEAQSDPGPIAEGAAPRVRLEKDAAAAAEPAQSAESVVREKAPAPEPAAAVAPPEAEASPVAPVPEHAAPTHPSQWFDAPLPSQQKQYTGDYDPTAAPQVMMPAGPGRNRPLGGYDPEFGPDFATNDADFVLDDDAYYAAFRKCANENGAFPTPLQFGSYLFDLHGHELPLNELELMTKQYQQPPHTTNGGSPALAARNRSPRTAHATITPVTETPTQAPDQQEAPSTTADSTESKQVALVAQKLKEAEKQGQKLTGTDVARLLGVPGRTARRRLQRAREQHTTSQSTITAT
ncbi:membrane protein [Streptomyces spiroverticillatus]|uniref:Membrane protein n=1 Tax=Streptomyces finlayi TaxID=67296 RepID=A0A918XA14_9ACTN|nr:DUF2637 domain-containing protein [Streptomyces finlayi]GHA48077.1 membrane protein [Streptomyces spiroverticillatus]GHD18911.1 membrane protein [Streptomyces finlayi]